MIALIVFSYLVCAGCVSGYMCGHAAEMIGIYIQLHIAMLNSLKSQQIKFCQVSCAFP